ncbi:MAG TPA: glucosamine-6-phosphate deaminase [Vicinamibacterales bacterium]|nr:glucosamine-6-phosphate deaminase [Vicinamibacterales bacterium]
MRIERFDSDCTAANRLAEIVAAQIASRPDSVLGLPAGRTPVPFYRRLVELTSGQHLDWSRVRVFTLDEFAGTSGTDRQPYARFMYEHLYRHVNVSQQLVDSPDGRAPSIATEASRYESAIAAAGLDLVVLGIGTNGHIGFNEPGPVVRPRTHLVTLAPSSRAGNAFLFDGDLARVPGEALTVGIATILSAKRILLIATGQSKARAISRLAEGHVTTRLPASFLHLHNDATVIVDDAASRRIPRELRAGS